MAATSQSWPPLLFDVRYFLYLVVSWDIHTAVFKRYSSGIQSIISSSLNFWIDFPDVVAVDDVVVACRRPCRADTLSSTSILPPSPGGGS